MMPAGHLPLPSGAHAYEGSEPYRQPHAHPPCSPPVSSPEGEKGTSSRWYGRTIPPWRSLTIKMVQAQTRTSVLPDMIPLLNQKRYDAVVLGNADPALYLTCKLADFCCSSFDFVLQMPLQEFIFSRNSRHSSNQVGRSKRLPGYKSRKASFCRFTCETFIGIEAVPSELQ